VGGLQGVIWVLGCGFPAVQHHSLHHQRRWIQPVHGLPLGEKVAWGVQVSSAVFSQDEALQEKAVLGPAGHRFQLQGRIPWPEGNARTDGMTETDHVRIHDRPLRLRRLHETPTSLASDAAPFSFAVDAGYPRLTNGNPLCCDLSHSGRVICKFTTDATRVYAWRK